MSAAGSVNIILSSRRRSLETFGGARKSWRTIAVRIEPMKNESRICLSSYDSTLRDCRDVRTRRLRRSWYEYYNFIFTSVSISWTARNLRCMMSLPELAYILKRAYYVLKRVRSWCITVKPPP